MLRITDLTSSRKFKIKNFEEDKAATLSSNKGLHYLGKVEDEFDVSFHQFKGGYYLTNDNYELIESFEISILIKASSPDAYPNSFPIVFLLDDKIKKIEDNHISESGLICFEHTYICNHLAKSGLRIYDFCNYFLKKYFCWVLYKPFDKSNDLIEWQHKERGTIQFYELLLGTKNKSKIELFIDNYCNSPNINRNRQCYCGSGKKLKYCHYKLALILKSTSLDKIKEDFLSF